MTATAIRWSPPTGSRRISTIRKSRSRRDVQAAGMMPLPIDDYLAAHIPGAVFFDVDAVSDHSLSLPHMFPDAAHFARRVGALGISNGDTVVVYDSGGWVAAPRAWWMFLAFGHANVQSARWRLEEMAGRRSPDECRQGDAKARQISGHARSVLRSQQAADWSATSPRGGTGDRCASAPALRGQVPEPRPGLRGGHIPGSRNLPYAELFDASTGTMKPLDDLRQLFSSAGVDLTSRSLRPADPAYRPRC